MTMPNAYNKSVLDDGCNKRATHKQCKTASHSINGRNKMKEDRVMRTGGTKQ